MFAYLAFKGLSWNNFRQTLFSPIVYTAWSKVITLWGEFFYLKADAGQLDRGYGIFASTPDEAKRYALEIYLVAPDPNCRIALGSLGWRAEAAMVVAYVITRESAVAAIKPVITKESAAMQILAAYRAGYPQVPGILAWAARYAPPKEGVSILENVLCDSQDKGVLQIVIDSLGSMGEEGRQLIDKIFDKLISGEYPKISPRL
jgi:hypothetical protein